MIDSHNDLRRTAIWTNVSCGAHIEAIWPVWIPNSDIWIIPSGEESTPNIMSTKNHRPLEGFFLHIHNLFFLILALKETPMTPCSDTMPAVIRKVATVASSCPSRSMRRRRNSRAAPSGELSPKNPFVCRHFWRMTFRNSSGWDISYSFLEGSGYRYHL